MTRQDPSISRVPDDPSPEDRWRTGEITELADALITLRTSDEALRFLRDLCTINELKELGQRWHVARLLDEGVSYHEISERTGASSATISRVAQWLRYGRDGYRLVIDRRLRRRGRRERGGS
ncbi:MAG TPA: YerC/YecD family TrpR-related protein [Candidatus Limnocylindria bacterium]